MPFSWKQTCLFLVVTGTTVASVTIWIRSSKEDSQFSSYAIPQVVMKKITQHDPDALFFMIADQWVANGNPQKAIDHLLSEKLKGGREVERLVRLALLTSPQNLDLGLHYLADARELTSHPIRIDLLTAEVLEKYQSPEAAEKVYYSLLARSENFTTVADAFAEFYIRQGRYQEALLVWQEVTPHHPKVAFWSEVAYPADKENFHTIEAHPEKRAWLEVIGALLSQKEEKAAKLLNDTDHKLAPTLAYTLKQILYFRKHGAFIPTPPDQIPDHPFCHQLSTDNPVKISPNLLSLITSDEAFAAAFLIQGWDEGALRLHSLSVYPTNFPEWVAHSMIVAMRKNRNNDAAIAFTNRQTKSPHLSLLMGEMLLEEGQVDEAEKVLAALLGDQSGVGYRAAWILAMHQAEQERYSLARETIEAQPHLAQDLLGKEALAKIALQEGNIEKAEQLYRELQAESTEAKSYLAERALLKNEWVRAQVLLLELLTENPESPELDDLLRLTNRHLEKGDHIASRDYNLYERNRDDIRDSYQRYYQKVYHRRTPLPPDLPPYRYLPEYVYPSECP